MRIARKFIRLSGLFGLYFAIVAPPALADDLGRSGLDQIESAEISESETVRWLGFRVFDITVYTEGGNRYDPDKPSALELRYARRFSKKSLMTATMEEFERLEGPRDDQKTIESKLTTCFADVGPGDKFLAVGIARNQVNLYRNNRHTCRLEHPNIRTRFLDIWLSLNSRFPAVSRRLRGL